MGTNYYLKKVEAVCPCCKRPEEELHIGKSSGGWVFALHIIPEKGIKDLPDWVNLWGQPGVEIRDEYGDVVEPSLMLKIITERSWPVKHKPWTKEQLQVNYAKPGPNNLVRSRLHQAGSGTWDLHLEEFS